MKYDQMQINAQNGDNLYLWGTINKVIFDGYEKWLFKDEDEIKNSWFSWNKKEGDELHVKSWKIKEGVTKPPARYSEASL